jgi:flagellar motor switch protein FliN/FliY
MNTALLVAPADLTAVANAVAGALPGGTAFQPVPVTGDLDERALPLSMPRAISAQVLDGAGTLVLVVSADLGAQLEALAQDLVAGSLPALAEAVEALSASLGQDVKIEAPMEVAAAIALPASGTVAAAQLLDGAEVVATIAFGLNGDAGSPRAADPGPAGSAVAFAGGHSLDVLSEVEMGLTAELGRTRMLVRDILNLAPGSVIELDRAAGSPVDILVNGTLLARGEVVVVDQEYGVRITEIIGRDSDRRGRR